MVETEDGVSIGVEDCLFRRKTLLIICWRSWRSWRGLQGQWRMIGGFRNWRRGGFFTVKSTYKKLEKELVLEGGRRGFTRGVFENI